MTAYYIAGRVSFTQTALETTHQHKTHRCVLLLLLSLCLIIHTSLALADRTVTYSYTPQGQIASMDGSRTDVNDLTTFEYDTAGNLIKTTNALGHVIQITDHDASGRPLRLVDANQVVTTFSYHPRGWLTSVTINGHTTSYDYDPVGQLIKIIQPSGHFIRYSYDDAHRLTDITDQAGNTLHYTLDAAGNPLKQENKNSAGVLARVIEQEYDQLGRLLLRIGGVNNATQRYQYDANNNLIAQTDARQTPTDRNSAKTLDPASLENTQNDYYDALNRLISQVNQLTPADASDDVITDYTYNALDQLTSVTDPNGNTTHYSYNVYGEITQQQSPDTGITTYSYDDAGNRIQQTDANGVTVNYSYDALNRLLTIDYADNAYDVSFSYDNCSHGVGRLCQVQDAVGTTQYSYDSWGNLTEENLLYQGNTYTTSYLYDENNQLVDISYPNQLYLSYFRNARGQIQEVSQEFNFQYSILSYLEYAADGQLTYQSLGNGLSHGYQYDLQGRLTGLFLQDGSQLVLGKYYTYDANDNVLEDWRVGHSRLYHYDGLNRLFFESRGLNDEYAGGIYHERDRNGNLIFRWQGEVNPASDEQTGLYYQANSNRLNAINSTPIQLDATGNSLNDTQGNQFSYDPSGRLSQVHHNGTLIASYRYNSRGQRVEKILHQSTGDQTTLYLYNPAGHLIAEYENGQATTNYIWIDDRLLAQINFSQSPSGELTIDKTTYFTTDYLTTPRIGTDEQKNIVWRWESDGYGQEAPQTTADHQGQTRTINMRYPGQYADQETGLYYNYHRYYDPTTGRYITSDPIGLVGGLNTYAYVGGNPVNAVDLFGLFPNCFRGAPRVKITTDTPTEENEILNIRLLQPENYGIGIGGNAPSRGVPIGPELAMDWYLWEHILYEYNEFEITKTVTITTIWCEDKKDCGEPIRFNYDVFDEKTTKKLIGHYQRWQSRRLYKVGRNSFGLP